MTEKKNRKDRIENVTYPILPCKTLGFGIYGKNFSTGYSNRFNIFLTEDNEEEDKQ